MDGANLIFIVMPIVIPIVLFFFIGLPLISDGEISKRQRAVAERRWAAIAAENQSRLGSARSPDLLPAPAPPGLVAGHDERELRAPARSSGPAASSGRDRAARS